MPFEPGHQLSVGPKKRHVYDAMMREVVQSPAKLKEACAKVLDAAANGDINALDWIATRLEGRPAQVAPDTGETVADVSIIKMIVMQANPNQFNELATLQGETVKEISQVESIPSLPTPPTPVRSLSDTGVGDE